MESGDNFLKKAIKKSFPEGKTCLQYSINEIYGFRKLGKFHEAKQKYNEIYHIYGELTEEGNVDPECIITEDSNSGYYFSIKT